MKKKMKNGKDARVPLVSADGERKYYPEAGEGCMKFLHRIAEEEEDGYIRFMKITPGALDYAEDGTDRNGYNFNQLAFFCCTFEGFDSPDTTLMFFNSILEGCAFKDSNVRIDFLSKTEVMDCDFTNIDLNKCTIENSVFEGCSFDGVGIMLSRILRTAFDLCTFKNTSFKYSDVEAVSMDYCYFDDATVIPNIPMSVNLEGEIIGWMPAYNDDTASIALCKMQVPAYAKRVRWISLLCRCSDAVILELQDIFTGKPIENTKGYVLRSRSYDSQIDCKANVPISRPFNNDRWDEHCEDAGIEFFTDREAAATLAVRQFEYSRVELDTTSHPNRIIIPDTSEKCIDASGAIDGDMETGVCTGRVPEGRAENFDGKGRNYRFDLRDCMSCIYFVYGDEDCGVDRGCLYTGKKERIYNWMGEGCICDFYSPDDEQIERENEQKEYDVKNYGNKI